MLFTVITLILIIADQISKIFAIKYLKTLGSFEVIKDFFRFTYVENTGAAFGILSNARWIFMLVTALAIIIMIYYKIKYKPQSKTLNISLILLLSGAVGNMIDRLFRGYVVDMLEVTFINYPVFNIADCFVVIGAILISVYILFIYKEPKKESLKESKFKADK